MAVSVEICAFGGVFPAGEMTKEDLVGKRGHDTQSNDVATDGKDSDGGDDKACIERTDTVVVGVLERVEVVWLRGEVGEIDKSISELLERRPRRRGQHDDMYVKIKAISWIKK